MWNAGFFERYEGTFDVECLRQSVGHLVRKHTILRVRVDESDGKVPCCVDGGYSVSQLFTHIPLHASATGVSDEQIRRMCIAEICQPFDLEQGPLFRCKLLTTEPHEAYFIAVIHHVISDFLSARTIKRELISVYNHLYTGGQIRDSHVAQYSDYIVHQQADRRAQELDRHYWASQYQKPVPPLNLPTDYPRPPIPSYMGDYEEFTLDKRLHERLNAFAIRHRLPLSTVLLANFYLLLSRHSGEQDIAVGIHYSKRHCYGFDFDHTVGNFVHTLPVRISYDRAGRSVLDCVQRIGTCLDEAYSHHNSPFDHMVSAIGSAEDALQVSPYQAEFNFISTSGAEDQESFLGLQLHFMDDQVNTSAQADIGLHVVNFKNGLVSSEMKLIVLYATDLFTQKHIARMVRQFIHILSQVVQSPDASLASISLIDDAEFDQVIRRFNDTGYSYPTGRLISELIEEAARQYPGNTALVCEDDRLTYQQLVSKVNCRAAYLHDRGFGPGMVAGILLGASIEALIWLLAVLHAGGVYLPLDPMHPKERLSFMLKDSGASLLLTRSLFLSEAALYAGEVVCIDTVRDNPRHLDPVKLLSASTDAACLIYVSGSAGTPNATLISHRAILNLVFGIRDIIPFSQGKCMLCSAPHVSHRFILESLIPLSQGMKVVIATVEQQQGSERLAEVIARNNVEMIQAVPSQMQLIVETEAYCLANLSEILVGGEVLSAELFEALSGATSATIYHTYGLTEATGCCTVKCVRNKEDLTIGRPIANTAVYVLDAQLRPMPVGTPGELFIGGHGLAIGYLNRSALTAASFLPNPFSPGGYIYRTGDLARWKDNGEIEYIGRIDNQVKVRGFRVELGEIESVLSEHADVREAVVIAREDSPGDKRLVAYVVMAKASQTSTLSLRSFLRGRLPHYMIPSSFVVSDELPCTPGGDVDRKRLLLLGGDMMLAGLGYIPPTSLVEKAIAAVFQDVLGVERVGLRDTFFDLGGHSLSALTVISRIHDALGVQIPPIRLFTRNLGQIAEECAQIGK